MFVEGLAMQRQIPRTAVWGKLTGKLAASDYFTGACGVGQSMAVERVRETCPLTVLTDDL